MRSAFHSFANFLACRLVGLILAPASRIRVLHPENVAREGAFLLAANHISHFDPPTISSVVRRKIDWMAMAEFFPVPGLGAFLRAVDAFPADRERAGRATIRTALERLRAGRIVGIFPEGGIRDGARSLLEGAPLRSGTVAFAHMASVAIVPCVILGTDRLYGKHNWLPFRRAPIWLGFGQAIVPGAGRDKTAERAALEAQLAAAFKDLYAEMQREFRLQLADLPHPPHERMKNPTPGGLRRLSALTVDYAMCASMNFVQSRHRLNPRSREELERYVADCEKLDVHQFYAAANGHASAGRIPERYGESLTWTSPLRTGFAENDVARADFFPSAKGWSGPTVLMLHALMSASHIGYRRWAKHFNDLGWNACFVHLPYHYSRVPRGYWNGELAITADLIRNAEGLRQGVIEVRQLLATLRAQGGRDFGILGTSYGAWIGALLATVEADFRFLALMAPIVHVEHAIWECPATAFMRSELRRAQIEPSLVARHYHLSSPLSTNPPTRADGVLLAAGEFDLIARPTDVAALHEKWRGSELLRVRQGHFGYRMMRETVERLKQRGL